MFIYWVRFMLKRCWMVVSGTLEARIVLFHDVGNPRFACDCCNTMLLENFVVQMISSTDSEILTTNVDHTEFDPVC